MKPLPPFEREARLLSELQRLYEDDVTPGELLRTLRKQVLGFSQERYAALAGISRRTLSDIEQDKESASLNTLNRAFMPLGLKAGLLPRQNTMMQQLLHQLSHKDEANDDT
ncbi:helix-turn-helix domain-containing protein [[Erwinia] mediterraneensis]|uniref:helix-turn-helix domain-containing protein n=1 Tax=[Erwinia] mediterraneensis TaxID=2161819 RepID=UPI001F25A04C|nr:helix-turn-helix domain-containing protein [[Erwinia] mediterraneensis]